MRILGTAQIISGMHIAEFSIIEPNRAVSEQLFLTPFIAFNRAISHNLMNIQPYDAHHVFIFFIYIE